MLHFVTDPEIYSLFSVTHLSHFARKEYYIFHDLNFLERECVVVVGFPR